jgi:glycosyltransferase involved in cell wall biosynthesis
MCSKVNVDITVLSGISRESGGLFYAVSSLCKALAQGNEMSVRVLGAKKTSTASDLAFWKPVPVQAYKAYGPLQSSVVLRRWLADAEPDLVHRHGIWTDPQWAALQWQKRTGKPVVISPHGMLDPWATRNSAWKKKLAGALFANESLRRATCIHALSRSEMESIRAYGLTNPIALIPNGVELPPIDTSNPRPPASTQQKQLLFLGRIHPKKGLAELIQAWSAAHETWRKEWSLIIAGWDDGGHEQSLRKLANNLGAGESVSFLGPQFGDQKEALLRNVDAFILPSFSEGLPMSVLEAWSYGLPVLMTDFCNIPEGFEASAAIRIEPNEMSVAQGLGQLSTMSASDLESMGFNGRKLVERKFVWPKIAAEMKAVYEWCMGGRDVPDCLIRD